MRATHGFTMLEVLVAILVVSLGLLGLAGLQTVGLRNNTSSAQRTIATQLAYDIADRMRGNYAGFLSGDYNYLNYGAMPDSVDCRRQLVARPPATTCDYSPTAVAAAPAGLNTANCTGTTTGCTSRELSYEDIYEWNQQICAQLPQGTACSAAVTAASVPWGVVCTDSTPNDGTPAAPLCDGAPGAPYVIKIWWLEDRNNPTVTPKQWVTTFVP